MPQVKTLSEYEAHLVNAVRDEFWCRLGGTRAEAIEQIRRNLDLPADHPGAAWLLDRAEAAATGDVIDLTPVPASGVPASPEPPWSL